MVKLSSFSDPWPRPEGFRLVAFATSLESPGTTYGPWQTDAYGLAWVVEGGGVTSYDGTRITTKPGTVLCARPDMLASHDWGGARCFQAFINFRADGFAPPWPAPSSWPLSRDLPADHVFFALFRALLGFDAKATDAPDAQALTVPLAELLLRVFVSGAEQREGQLLAVLPEAVERAMAAIRGAVEAVPSEPVRLPALAKSAHVTPQHLCRLFRESLGLGPIECAQALRLELAVSLIERTEQSLSQIAERYGFSSPFHLSKAFKQSYGMSPAAYRQAFRAGATARPPGLMFRNHPLRHYFYEAGPGKIMKPPFE